MNQHKQYKPRQISYNVDVIVSYVPFPSEKARDEAYDTHVRLFLRAKEREFMDRLKDKKINSYVP